jgi:hypothetical protein
LFYSLLRGELRGKLIKMMPNAHLANISALFGTYKMTHGGANFKLFRRKTSSVARINFSL